MAKRPGVRFHDVHRFVEDLVGEDLHAKRVYSLANATLGAMTSGSLAVHAIGQGLALARGLRTKHAVKQVDRLLSNRGIDPWALAEHWVPYVLAERAAAVVALDWTDFDADGQTSIVASLVTGQGRAIPLVWRTVEKATLKDARNDHEDAVLRRLREVVPAGVAVTVVADRGFGDQKLYRFLSEELGFGYVIRFRGVIYVSDAKGNTKAAAEWVGPGGKARTLRAAAVTAERYPVATVVCVWDKDMAEPWCLAASDPEASAATLIGYYARRWEIESSFRDSKNLRFGMGLGLARVKDCERRDRLWLLSALAMVLLTLLGMAGESLGYDRMLKANTVKRRTHSLFRQGVMLYELIPMMPEERLRPLVQRFGEMLLGQRTFTAVFGLA
jgi:hypothetical protein